MGSTAPSDESDEDIEHQATTTTSRDRDRKTRLVAQVLARWWYVMGPWPPPEFDYDSELKARRLKRVTFDDWELEDDVDDQGFHKVYEITHFPGIFRDAAGNIIDLRPQEGKPCFSNLVQFSEAKLQKMLKTAIENQLKELEHSPYAITDSHIIAKLQQELSKAAKNI